MPEETRNFEKEVVRCLQRIRTEIERFKTDQVAVLRTLENEMYRLRRELNDKAASVIIGRAEAVEETLRNQLPILVEDALRVRLPICARNWFVAQDMMGIWIHQNGDTCGLDKCTAADPTQFRPEAKP